MKGNRKRKYGPILKQLDQVQVEFLQTYLREKGYYWCAQRVGVSHTTLRSMIKRWEEGHGKIEFIEPRPIPREPRRLFQAVKPYNSCRRWPEIIRSDTACPSSTLRGQRIA